MLYNFVAESFHTKTVIASRVCRYSIDSLLLISRIISLPIVVRCRCVYSDCLPAAEATRAPEVKHLRWDHADLLQYYNTMMSLLYPLYNDLFQFETVQYASDNEERRTFYRVRLVYITTINTHTFNKL